MLDASRMSSIGLKEAAQRCHAPEAPRQDARLRDRSRDFPISVDVLPPPLDGAANTLGEPDPGGEADLLAQAGNVGHDAWRVAVPRRERTEVDMVEPVRRTTNLLDDRAHGNRLPRGDVDWSLDIACDERGERTGYVVDVEEVAHLGALGARHALSGQEPASDRRNQAL